VKVSPGAGTFTIGGAEGPADPARGPRRQEGGRAREFPRRIGGPRAEERYQSSSRNSDEEQVAHALASSRRWHPLRDVRQLGSPRRRSWGGEEAHPTSDERTPTPAAARERNQQTEKSLGGSRWKPRFTEEARQGFHHSRAGHDGRRGPATSAASEA